jgi:hypothetical protein
MENKQQKEKTNSIIMYKKALNFSEKASLFREYSFLMPIH